jgi:hypothetical protein
MASVFFIFWGLILNAPGAVKVSTIYIFWPILYLYFISTNAELKQIYYYSNILLYAGLIGSLLIALFIINEFIPLPVIDIIAKAQDFHAGFYDGFIEMHSANITSIIYVFTYCFTLFIFGEKQNMSNRKLLFLCLLSSVILLLISGRRAFWMVMFLCPVIIFIAFKLVKIKIPTKTYIYSLIIAVLMIIMSFYIFSLDIDLILKEISSVFEFNSTDEGMSNYLRKEQYDALITGWKERPLLGWGHGAGAIDSIRSKESPWEYELSYLALLFQTGLIGFIIYTLSVLWIFMQSVIVLRRHQEYAPFLLPSLIALVCFLIINATNPYLFKFDYLWTLYFPIFILNSFLINARSYS